MKLDCKCGEVVNCIDGSEAFLWMSSQQWTNLVEAIEFHIEGLRDLDKKDEAIMGILKVAASQPAWKCIECQRVLTLSNGEVVYLIQE
jgi:hypothetical protein